MRSQLVFLTALLLGTATIGCLDGYSNSEAWGKKSVLKGTGGTGGDTGGGGTGGTTTTAPKECIPSDASTPVDDECGVFVSQSKGNDADGKGTKDSPVQTLPKAIELATLQGKPVYVCGETFPGPIQIPNSALLYGALDCASDWKHLGAQGRTVITADADIVPLAIQGSADIEMHDFSVVAADAMAKGGSSIAITVDGAAALNMFTSDVAAGLGSAGADAEAIGGKATDGTMGSTGVDACTTAQAVTPDPPVNDCGGEQSIGGAGGIGAVSAPLAGGAGQPGGDTFNNAGGAQGNMNPCGPGQDNNSDVPHDGGPGEGAMTGVGTLTGESGFVGVAGTDGQPGKPGQGGGGGGGSKGGTGSGKCSDANLAAGASGGSGGSGGCGGQGGKGGGGGGASIAIASFGGKVSLEKVELTAKDGGRGGFGGQGQLGGTGAVGGPGGKATGFNNLSGGCQGGKGVDGGKGGPGGGGMGGHSIGIAYKNGIEPQTTDVTFNLGVPGVGGMGEGANGTGKSGIVEQIQPF